MPEKGFLRIYKHWEPKKPLVFTVWTHKYMLVVLFRDFHYYNHEQYFFLLISL